MGAARHPVKRRRRKPHRLTPHQPPARHCRASGQAGLPPSRQRPPSGPGWTPRSRCLCSALASCCRPSAPPKPSAPPRSSPRRRPRSAPGISGCGCGRVNQAGGNSGGPRSARSSVHRRRPRPVPDADAGRRPDRTAHAVAADRVARHAARGVAGAFPRQRRGDRRDRAGDRPLPAAGVREFHVSASAHPRSSAPWPCPGSPTSTPARRRSSTRRSTSNCARCSISSRWRGRTTASVTTRRGAPIRVRSAACCRAPTRSSAVSGFWREQRQAAPEPEVRAAGPRGIRPLARRDRPPWPRPCCAAVSSPAPARPSSETMAQVLDEWRREPVPGDALAVARRKSDRHLARWQANNGQADTG